VVLKLDVLARIQSGEITLAVRRWRRPAARFELRRESW
jgi:hypothetical protein